METRIPGRHGDTPAYARLPDGASRGIVVVHEVFGRRPDMDGVVDRFADAGFAAVLPDLFHGGGVRCVAAALWEAARGEGPNTDRLREARAWLAGRAGIAEERVGIIGFCMGGGFALASGPGWGPVSANYGPAPAAPVLARGASPVLACYGGRDLAFVRERRKLEASLAEVGRPGEVVVYPDAGHSFLTDGASFLERGAVGRVLRIAYRPDDATAAWARIHAFFDEHLPA